MAIHGLPRATMDIDLLVLAEDVVKALSVARASGYDVEGLPLSFDDGAFELRRISKIDRERRELVTVDFLFVTGAFKDVLGECGLLIWSYEGRVEKRSDKDETARGQGARLTRHQGT